MSKKIKSVTFKQVIYSSPDAAIEEKENSFKITHNILGKDTWIEIGKDLVKNIEYEPEPEPEKPGQLFYPNGAVVRPLEENQRYWCIDYGEVKNYTWVGDRADLYNLESQIIFLTKGAAEKAKHVQDTHNRLLKRVVEINAEQGWVADWAQPDWSVCGFNNYSVSWDHEYGTKNRVGYNVDQKGMIYMCQEAADWLLSDEVSDTDFKSFCLIYE